MAKQILLITDPKRTKDLTDKLNSLPVSQNDLSKEYIREPMIILSEIYVKEDPRILKFNYQYEGYVRIWKGHNDYFCKTDNVPDYKPMHFFFKTKEWHVEKNSIIGEEEMGGVVIRTTIDPLTEV